MEIRVFLSGLAILCLSVGGAPISAGAQQSEKPVWSYSGDHDPHAWPKLDDAFQVCGEGQAQSPIDLSDPITAQLDRPEFYWRSMSLDLVNNGRTIEAHVPEGSFLVLDNVRYDLVQFHFHTPSEHTIAGEPFQMEVHFVHRSKQGDLTVVAVFLMVGAENAALAPIFDNLPKEVDGHVVSDTIVRPFDLLPDDVELFRYAGSLTTPPCTENVLWLIERRPAEISQEQLAAFQAILPKNARPTQPRMRRFLLRSD